ncbi:MAG: heme exporter protein CcmB [Acidimicrobiales bacterium]
MWRDALLVATKDLRIEMRSRVTVNQVAPLSVLMLILFAFALGPDRKPLVAASAGLYWVAVLFAAVLAVQRSFAIESAESARDGLRLWGLDPAGVFLGKAAAVGVQLLFLEVLMGAGVVLLYGAHITGILAAILTCVLATAGLAAVGVSYGAISSGLRVRETLLPLLMLPVVAPVLLAATQSWRSAVSGATSNGEPWMALLAVFAAVYLAAGVLAFGSLLEES